MRTATITDLKKETYIAIMRLISANDYRRTVIPFLRILLICYKPISIVMNEKYIFSSHSLFRNQSKRIYVLNFLFEFS